MPRHSTLGQVRRAAKLPALRSSTQRPHRCITCNRQHACRHNRNTRRRFGPGEEQIQAALPGVPELRALALTLEGTACTSVQGLEALAVFLSHIEQQPHGNVACHVTSSADMDAF